MRGIDAMKKAILLAGIAIVLSPFCGFSKEAARASETRDASGALEVDIGVTGLYPSISGNEAKFTEYGDMKDGVLGAYSSVFLSYDNRKGYFLDFSALDIGYQTQSYRLEGRKSGDFRYFFFYKEIPHNVTWDALTPYATPGSNNLVYIGDITSNIRSWTPFDYSTVRKSYGGGITVERLKPFYIDFSMSQESRKGIKPFGAEGASGFGSAIELPAPVDYMTDMLKAEVGYARQPLFISAKYMFSRFNTNDETLYFRNPFLSIQPNRDTISLAPDNRYEKFALVGNVKLPLRTKFNMNLAYSNAKSEVNLSNSLWQGDVLTPVALTSNSFDGALRKTVSDFVLTSSPVSRLEGKIYYKYLKTKNRSDSITSADVTGLLTNVPFDYAKKTFGGEIDFKIAKGLHFLGGYKHVNLDRNWIDLPENNDNIYTAGLLYRFMQYGVLRLTYEKLHRTADIVYGDLSDANRIKLYQKRYDTAPKDRDTLMMTAQLTPFDALNVNLGYKYAETDYNDTVLGIQRDRLDEINLDVDYIINKYIRFFGYLDFEKRKTSQFQRSFISDPDPFGAVQNGSNFNWTSDQRDKTYDFGAAIDIHILPTRLSLRLSYDNTKSNGMNDLTYLAATALSGGRTNDNIDMSAWDDYRREYFMAKILYRVSPYLMLTGGYAYERYRSSDAQYNGYEYSVGPSTYLTGVYSRPEYKASIVFLGLNYKFR